MTKRVVENEIIPYLEMCKREETSLQRGMNFRISKSHSVILMSLRKNAPYNDALVDNGNILMYEGHDAPRTAEVIDPKIIDQPEMFPSGRLTQNGLFHKAAQGYKYGKSKAELVRVYEKIMQGVWAYNGLFSLVDSWIEKANNRFVFKFKLVLLTRDSVRLNTVEDLSGGRRIIPSLVKLEVWKRDGGRCVICGAKTELHFDHIVPYSKGGASNTVENIQLLCARHNIAKSDKIE